MSLNGRRDDNEAQHKAELAPAVGLKTLAQPLLAFLVARYALHLPHDELLAVVLCSALPTAQNLFIYAQEYGRPTALPRDVVIVSTLVSMVALSLVVSLLGPV